jgi:hypothetical protein
MACKTNNPIGMLKIHLENSRLHNQGEDEELWAKVDELIGIIKGKK